MTSHQNETNPDEDYEGETWVSKIRENVNPKERNKRRTKAKREDFIHSLHNDSKHLNTFLTFVPDGIKEAAKTWEIPLDAADVHAVENPNCPGHYPMYIPENSTSGREKMKLKSLLMMGKSPAEIKAHHQEVHNIYISRSPRFSTIIAAATSKNYEQVLRGLWNFLAVAGKYEEMIMLLPHPPILDDDAVPSVSPTSIKEYVLHRYSEPFSKLYVHGDESKGPLKDINGRDILCEGTVNNYAWFDTLFAAISYLHQKAGKDGSYKPPCADCKALTGASPCPAHQGNGKTRIHYARTKGDPTKSFVITELRKWLEQESKRREYKPNRRSPFLPHDFTHFHSHLVSR